MKQHTFKTGKRTLTPCEPLQIWQPGKFNGVTNDSFQTSVYPHLQTGVSGARWVSLNQGGRQFLSLNSGWRWVWLGRTYAEATNFIQSINNSP